MIEEWEDFLQNPNFKIQMNMILYLFNSEILCNQELIVIDCRFLI